MSELDLEIVFYLLVNFVVIIFIGILLRIKIKRPYTGNEINAVFLIYVSSFLGTLLLNYDIKKAEIVSIILTFMVMAYPQKEEILKILERICIVTFFSYVFLYLRFYFSFKFLDHNWILLFTLVSLVAVYCWEKGILLRLLRYPEKRQIKI